MFDFRMIVILSLIWILNKLDILLQLLGIKLVKLTKNRIYKELTMEEIEEVNKADVAVPFQMYIKGLEKDTDLSLYRRLVMIRIIKNIFKVRVENAKLLRQSPEILQIPIKRPVIITSMPRTGTTFLSRLMGSDPRARAPALWEMAFPYLSRQTDNPKQTVFYKNAMMGLKIDTVQRGEKLNKIHLVSPDEPEECVVLTRLSFYQHVDFKRLPCLSEYESWFYASDHSHHLEVYRYYKTMLQLLAYKNEDKHFLLKGSIHLWNLEALMEIFPDACIIFNVRPMAQAVASFCSTMDYMLRFWRPVDSKYGRRMLRLLAEQTRRGAAAFEKFDQLPPEQNPVYFVDYKKLVEDPLTMVKKIYANFRIDMTDEAEECLQKYVDSHPQNKFGKHNYSLEQYGLTYEDVKREMKPYEDYMLRKGCSNII